MSTMIFDEHGCLTPYDLIPSDLDTIEAIFVKLHPNSRTRSNVFAAFVSYLTELKSVLNTPLEIWVNGSFTTQKRDPNDVDFVIFVDKQVATAHQSSIFQFRQQRYAKKSRTDGYFVETVPEDHPDYNLYQLDRQDWHRAFVFGRNGQKGYLQVILYDYEPDKTQ